MMRSTRLLLFIAISPGLIVAFCHAQNATSLDEIIADIATRDAQIRNVTVTADYVRGFGGMFEPQDVRKVDYSETITVTDDGRVRYEGTGGHPNGDRDIRHSTWLAACDGASMKLLKGPRVDRHDFGYIDRQVVWQGGFNPYELTSHFHNRSVAELLRTSESAKVVGHRRLRERDTVLIETGPVTRNDSQWKTSFWIDSERAGLIVRRSSSLRFLPDGEWQEYTFVDTWDHREFAPGIWLPTRSKHASISISKERSFIAFSLEGDGYKWKVNEDLPSDFFHLRFPIGCQVYDRRGPQPPGGYGFYKAGDTEADQRRVNFASEPASLKGTDTEGRSVRLRKNLKTIVYFWSVKSQPSLMGLNRLRQLHKQHEDRLQIIGVAIDDRQQVNEFLEERPVPWPTLCEVTGGHEQPTATHYNVINVPTWMLIGQDGKIAVIASDLKEIVAALDDANE